MANNSYKACNFDFDCPLPGSLCYDGNVSWFDATKYNVTSGGICFCNGGWGFGGVDCTALSATSYFILAEIGIMLVIATPFLLWGMWNVVRTLWVFKTNLKKAFSSAYFTLCICTAGLFSFWVWGISVFLSTMMPENFDTRISNAPDAEKLPWLEVMIRFSIFFTVFFFLVAPLHVSVLWIEIGYRANRLQNGMFGGITYYRNAVRIVEVLFAIAMAVLGILDLFSLATLVAAPLGFMIIIAFTIGRYRMVHLLNETLSMDRDGFRPVRPGDRIGDDGSSSISSGTSGGSPKIRKQSSTYAERTHRTLRAIKRTSNGVIFGLFIMLLCGTVFFVYDNPGNFGHRDICPPDGSLCSVAVISEGLRVGVLIVLISTFRYSVRAIRKITRKELKAIRFSKAVSPTRFRLTETHTTTTMTPRMTQVSSTIDPKL